jgi:chemotaxis protein MotB
MAKKKHEEHENHERWLVSYADFITLLFAFFVVMYSVSSVNEGKYRTVSDSIKAALNPVNSIPSSRLPFSIGDTKPKMIPPNQSLSMIPSSAECEKSYPGSILSSKET